jgi:hypothetical protein
MKTEACRWSARSLYLVHARLKLSRPVAQCNDRVHLGSCCRPVPVQLAVRCSRSRTPIHRNRADSCDKTATRLFWQPKVVDLIVQAEGSMFVDPSTPNVVVWSETRTINLTQVAR